MAPAKAANSPGTLTQRRVIPLSGTTLAHALYRVHPDGSTEPVSEHPDFGEGWAAGQSAVHADRDHAYALYTGSRRVARFGHARSTPRVSVSTLDALALIGAGS
jgi:hypothetical protein